MREAGIFYQTKRGEKIPSAYREPYLNTYLVEIGKLCLAGIFQLPCLNRAKPSSLYQQKYYEPIFNNNQSKIANLCKELLYIDYYFRTTYQKNLIKIIRILIPMQEYPFPQCKNDLCCFHRVSVKIQTKNITIQKLTPILSNSSSSSESIFDSLYESFRDLGKFQYFIPPKVFHNKELYDKILNKLFSFIVEKIIK